MRHLVISMVEVFIAIALIELMRYFKKLGENKKSGVYKFLYIFFCFIFASVVGIVTILLFVAGFSYISDMQYFKGIFLFLTGVVLSDRMVNQFYKFILSGRI